ncbi:putative translation initiation factor eIF-2B alpha subunit [Desulforapulum autotrophicum HRM2]|uniref:Methylthioribose-1-phosphate isomerase n=2 Tax=Desulforapulum autotrophicum TaxID=2296 RepID=C0QHS4_DESAH|nr:putative translation initiation factor eIF-2B alpha subunit [Desulforapulum autotrophicum HRM2]
MMTDKFQPMEEIKMLVDNQQMRPIWFDGEKKIARVIDQRMLPHKLVIADLNTVDDVIYAIQEMFVRGAPLIGATGAFGVYTALLQNQTCTSEDLVRECNRLKSARPTAVNLAWGVDRVLEACLNVNVPADRLNAARNEALAIVEDEAENCRQIGLHGLSIIQEISRKKGGAPVNILTHCNAGWLACIEYGTATAPMYTAFDQKIDIHVWVDETRPLNQGSRLTAWELGKHGINHTIITDNAGGHLMQHGMVDLVIVGTDRTTRSGDVANKIGTYLKALAAKDNNLPFYVALPSSTIDWEIDNGITDIPIEERDPEEIQYVQGLDQAGNLVKVLVPPLSSPAANHAFDVTPARLVTGLITERGICRATREDILALFPEKRATK